MKPANGLIWNSERCCNGLRWKVISVIFLVWLAGVGILWFFLPYQTQLLPYQARFKLPATEDSVVADFSGDGRVLATATWVPQGPPWMGSPVRLWDMQTGAEIKAYFPKGELAAAPVLSTDGRILMVETLASNGTKTLFSLVDTGSGVELLTITDRDRFGVGWLPPDGKTFVLERLREDFVEFWDIYAGRKRLMLNCWPASSSPDGQWFISKESESELRIRSMATGDVRLKISCETRLLYAPIVSSDGAFIAADCLHKEVIVWDASTGRELLHQNDSCIAKFTRDGKRLGVACPTGIKLFDTSTWQESQWTVSIPSPEEDWTWLQGPDADNFLIAYSKEQLSDPGKIDELKVRLGTQNRRSAKKSTETNVFVFPPWKQVAEFHSNGGEIHFSPDGKSLVEDSGSNPVFLKQPRECMKIYDLPLRKPFSVSRSFAIIVLWPVPFACLVIAILRIVNLTRKRGTSP